MRRYIHKLQATSNVSLCYNDLMLKRCSTVQNIVTEIVFEIVIEIVVEFFRTSSARSEKF